MNNRNSLEPTYVSDPFEEEDEQAVFKPNVPKWRLPGSEFEQKVLAVFGMKYYPPRKIKDTVTGSKAMRSKLIEISKSLVSLESGLDARYPTEFVLHVLDWCKQKDLYGWRGLKAFLNNLENEDWKMQFVREWREKHPEANYRARPKDEDDDFARYLRLPKG